MSETHKLNRIGIEVMKTDLGKMTWDEAKQACKKLGDDWRLPTIEELKLIQKYKDRIGGFTNLYWSSTKNGTSYMWIFSFRAGSVTTTIKSAPIYVRAVRDLE
jgi:hypothetical protein